MTPIRVVHLNWSDTVGGAARAAYRVHDSVRRAGADSTMLVELAEGGDPTVAVAPPTSGAAAVLVRRLRRGRYERIVLPHAAHIAAGYQLFSPGWTVDPGRARRALPPCDVIHLHWVSRFVDYAGFFPSLPPGVPVVWTLHDMNPFTGGCHYDAGCGRFAARCGRCPALESTADDDPSSRSLARNVAALRGRSVTIVSPSRWLGDEARRSTLFRDQPHELIPYGIDTTVFRPIDRAAARTVLGVPPDARVVLFIAESAAVRRKGIAHVVAAAERLATAVPGLTFLSLGKGTPPLPAGVPHVPLGFLSADKLLAVAYSAADVTVVPSLQDNLPNTVIESLACGTPVAGFAVGGIPDMVRDGVTGRVVAVGDPAALADAVAAMLKAPDPTPLRRSCRDVVVAEYALDVQGRRYVELYERLLSRE